MYAPSTEIIEDLPPPLLQVMQTKNTEQSQNRSKKNYNNNEALYKCCECCCRIAFCPIMGVMATASITYNIVFCPCTVLTACCCSEYYQTEKIKCCGQENFEWPWCCYTYIDDNIASWALCSIGCLRFPQDRTKDELKAIEDCSKCHCYTIDCYTSLCNSNCIKLISNCFDNLSEKLSDFICGSFKCCELFARRICCCGPPKCQITNQQ